MKEKLQMKNCLAHEREVKDKELLAHEREVTDEELQAPKIQADGEDIGTLSLHDKTKYKKLNGLLQINNHNENRYMGGNLLNYTIKSDINDIMNNKQNLMKIMMKLNDEINDIKLNNNDTDLYKNFELKDEILTNIGDHINNLSDSIKKGGDENISNKLNNDIYTYENIVNKIKNSNNNSNINIKYDENNVKTLLIKLHNKINNDFNDILNDNNKEYKQSKLNDLVDILNNIYENENIIIHIMTNTKNNNENNTMLTQKTKELQEYEKQNKIMNDIINEKYNKIINENMTNVPPIKDKDTNTYKYNNIISENENNINDDIYFDIYSNEINNINDINVDDNNYINYNKKQNITKVINDTIDVLEYINDKMYFNMLGKIKKYNDNKFFIISPKEFNKKNESIK